jgi:hypothetical protein
MLDLNKQQELAKSMPPQLLQAAAQGQHPMIAPHIAAAVAASRQYAQNAANLGAQAQNAPTETTIAGLMKQMAPVQSQPDATANALGAMRTGQMRQQQNMQQLAEQAQRGPVMAAQGGIMSATPRQPAGMAALIRQHLANPVKAADGGLMAIKRFSEGGPAQSLQSRIANLEAALKRYEKSGSDTRSIRQALLHAKSRMANMEMPNEIARLEGKYPAPPPEPVSTTDTGDETARLLNRYPAPPPPPAPPGPGTRNQPTAPTAAQPTAPAATGPGIPSLTADNVNRWEESLRGDYDQMGAASRPFDTYRKLAEDERLAREALFEAQQGGSKFDKLLNAMGGAGVLTSRDGSASSRGLAALQRLKEEQRVARPEFALSEAERASKFERELGDLGFEDKNKALAARAGVSGPMAREVSTQQGQDRRAVQANKWATTAADLAHRRAQEQARLNSSLRTQEALANPRGAGGGYDRERMEYLKQMAANIKTELADKALRFSDPPRHKELMDLQRLVQAELAAGIGLPIQSTDAAPDGVDLSKWGDPKMR